MSFDIDLALRDVDRAMLGCEALGLADRGVIAPGRRADLIIVEDAPQPRVVATIAGGKLVQLADQRLLA
ncbi:MAG: amidohydrolase family protein [Sphingomonadaceae bacterium]